MSESTLTKEFEVQRQAVEDVGLSWFKSNDIIDEKVRVFLNDHLKENFSVDEILYAIAPKYNFIFNVLCYGCAHDTPEDPYSKLRAVREWLKLDAFTDIDSWLQWQETLKQEFLNENGDKLATLTNHNSGEVQYALMQN